MMIAANDFLSVMMNPMKTCLTVFDLVTRSKRVTKTGVLHLLEHAVRHTCRNTTAPETVLVALNAEMKARPFVRLCVCVCLLKHSKKKKKDV